MKKKKKKQTSKAKLAALIASDLLKLEAKETKGKKKLKRLKIKGKNIPLSYEGLFRKMAKNNNKRVDIYIKENEEILNRYIKTDSIKWNYRTDDLIDLMLNHIGKIETIGYDFKGLPKLIKDLQEFKSNLINRKVIYIADFYFNVEIFVKEKKLIIDLSEMDELKKMSSDELDSADPVNITLVVSSMKFRNKKVRTKLANERKKKRLIEKKKKQLKAARLKIRKNGKKN